MLLLCNFKKLTSQIIIIFDFNEEVYQQIFLQSINYILKLNESNILIKINLRIYGNLWEIQVLTLVSLQFCLLTYNVWFWKTLWFTITIWGMFHNRLFIRVSFWCTLIDHKFVTFLTWGGGCKMVTNTSETKCKNRDSQTKYMEILRLANHESQWIRNQKS